MAWPSEYLCATVQTLEYFNFLPCERIVGTFIRVFSATRNQNPRSGGSEESMGWVHFGPKCRQILLKRVPTPVHNHNVLVLAVLAVWVGLVDLAALVALLG